MSARLRGCILFLITFAILMMYSQLRASLRVPWVTKIQIGSTGKSQPSALVTDPQGKTSYVLDGLNGKLRVFKPNDAIPQLSISLEPPISLEPRDKPINAAMDLAIVRDGFWVADTGNYRLLKFDHNGEEVDRISSNQLMSRQEQRLNPQQNDHKKRAPEPVSLWIDEDILYWGDRANHQICQYQLTLRKNLRCFASYGQSKAQLRFPYQMAMDKTGYLYVTDVLNGRVLIFNPRGQYFSQIGRFGVSPGTLYRPNGLAIDARGYTYVSDSYFGVISVYRQGRFLGYLREAQGEVIKFDAPVYLTINHNQLFVVDSLKHTISRLQLSYGEAKSQSGNNMQNWPSGNTSTHLIGSGKNCVSCHLSWSPSISSLLWTPNPDKELPVGSKKMCYSCHHGVVVESRKALLSHQQHPGRFKPQPSPSASFLLEKPGFSKKSPFPIDRDVEKNQLQLNCATCHTPHSSDEHQEVLYQQHNNAWLRVGNKQGNLCEKCHQAQGRMARESDLDMTQGQDYHNHPLKISPVLKNNHSTDKKTLPQVLKQQGAMLDSHGKMICQTCHQIHAGKGDALLVIDNSRGELCIACHQDKKSKGKRQAQEQGMHPVDMQLESPQRVNGKLTEALTCSTCHRLHNQQANPNLLLQTDKAGQLCENCHEDKNNLISTAHDLRPDSPGSDENHQKDHNTLCRYCHRMHQGYRDENRLPMLYALKTQPRTDHSVEPVILQRDLMCLNCHQKQGQAKETPIQWFSHPHKDLILRSDPEVMPLIRKGSNKEMIDEFGLIACISCHNPHLGDKDIGAEDSPKNHHLQMIRKKFLHQDSVKGTFCQSCHGIEARLKYQYFHDKSVSRTEGIHYLK